ncbi:MAG TPA: ABC transporter permease, partial [Candidatus Dormibacteraeota bacterium]
MLTYVARRVLISIPTIFGVATVIFLLVRLLPGDPARTIAGVLATPEDVERIRHQFGFDQPLYVQYVTYMTHLLTGNLGVS